MELVGPHHAVDLIALTLGVEMGDRSPEAGDLEHHLCAIVAQERQVAGGLEVVPDVVEDCGVDVALVTAQVRLPAPRQRVEVHALGLFGALAGALPWKHRPVKPRLARRCTRFV